MLHQLGGFVSIVLSVQDEDRVATCIGGPIPYAHGGKIFVVAK